MSREKKGQIGGPPDHKDARKSRGGKTSKKGEKRYRKTEVYRKGGKGGLCRQLKRISARQAYLKKITASRKREILLGDKRGGKGHLKFAKTIKGSVSHDLETSQTT